MSTKDIRFILPTYPIFCIYLSIFINSEKVKFFSIKSKKLILIVSISFSILMSNNFLSLEKNKAKSFYDWHHDDVINEVTQYSPNLFSTIAILPDTKEINTFNLEAAAIKKGEKVAFRQIVSNKESYKEDLQFFDWFLVKTKDQGIMTNESKRLLNEYLLNNDSFITYKKWSLPDTSELMLLRRREISSLLSQIDCLNKSASLNIRQIDNGINLTLSGEGSLIGSANLLLDFIGEESKELANISLANGTFHRDFDNEKCYVLSQNISINFPKDISKNLFVNARIINKEGSIQNLNIERNYLKINEKFNKSNSLLMTNRISKVENLGNFLKKGEYKNLFNLVGIINQSDPKQQYLKDAEKIYIQRYLDNNDLDDLYSLLISQILQRKVIEANKTIKLILEKDTNNGNTYLAKSIIDIYLFDGKNARLSLNNAKNLKKSAESDEIIKTIEFLIYLLEMKFINAYKSII